MNKNPICKKCGIEAKPVIASPNQIYGADDFENPRGAMSIFTGEYYCPKCHRTVAPIIVKEKKRQSNKRLQIYCKETKKWELSTCFDTIKSFLRNKYTQHIFRIGEYDYYLYGTQNFYRYKLIIQSLEKIKC